MDDNVNRDIAFNALRIPRSNQLERRNKFDAGTVHFGNNTKAFLKVARYDKDPVASTDLSNEVSWFKQARKSIADAGFRTGEVLAFNPHYKWVLFSHLDGSTLNGQEVFENIDEIARLCAVISKIPLKREPNGVQSWFKKRVIESISKVVSELSEAIPPLDLLIDTSRLVEGFVHGDFKPENMLYLPSDKRPIAIVDSELGTNLEKPDRCLPRYLDAAYFYHLLICQYHNPEMAEIFKKSFMNYLDLREPEQIQEFETEFSLTVLERTISMGKHFIWDRDPSKVIADPRRLEPKPYENLIHTTIDSLV